MKNTRTLFFLAALAFAAALSGCAYPDMRKPPIRNYLRDVLVKTQRPPEPPRVTVSRLDEMRSAIQWDEVASADEYKVGPGDVIDVQVRPAGALEADAEFRSVVSASGTIRCPLLGEVPVEEMNTAQISDMLEDRYSERYYQRRPSVQVTVEEYRSKRVLVTGFVTQPGDYPIIGERTSLLHLLVEAGGLTELTSDTVVIRRASNRNGGSPASQNPQTETPEGDNPFVETTEDGLLGMDDVERINLDKLMLEGDLRSNVWVYPGDAVHVPRRRPEFYYIFGFVGSGGPQELPRYGDLGVAEAIIRAGGGGSGIARPQYTYLMRVVDGERVTFRIDVPPIVWGGQPDVPVRPDDWIIVSTDWGRRSIDAFFRVVGIGRAWAPTVGF